MQAVKSCKKHFFQKLKIYKKARNLHVTKPRCTPTIEISVDFYKNTIFTTYKIEFLMMCSKRLDLIFFVIIL